VIPFLVHFIDVLDFGGLVCRREDYLPMAGLSTSVGSAVKWSVKGSE